MIRTVFTACVVTLFSVLSHISPAQTPASASTDNSLQQPLTFELVHGPKRLNLAGAPPAKLTWLDDNRWIQPASTGWEIIAAADGSRTSWYDSTAVAAALQQITGCSPEDAQKLSSGGWSELLPSLQLALFHTSGRLVRINLATPRESASIELPATGERVELVTFSPTGDAAAFVFKNDLWLADFRTLQLRQLTTDGSRTLRNGKADWVYFEEVYNRSWKAFRFSPDGKWLAFQQFNDEGVPVFRISDHTTVAQVFEEEHYPQAGQANPTVRLGIVAVSGNEVQWLKTGDYPQDDFLLVNFQWLPNSSGLLWAAQNREQTWLDLLVSSDFGAPPRKLLRDQTPAWTDHHGDVRFLSDGSFLMFSERSGWKHLHRVTPDGAAITPLTSGDYEVRELLGVAADEQSLLVAAAKNSRIADAVFRISLSQPGSPPQCLTPEDGHHAASASPGCIWFADSHSTFQQPVQSTLRRASGEPVRVLAERLKLPADTYRFGRLEMRDLPMADGSTTKAIFVLPHNFDARQKYPVWLRTYGGPHTPVVKDQWNPRLADHLLAEMGIVVINFDPRTASGYGACSAWPAWKRLGAEETRDLQSVCNWLKSQPWADASRVGLSGHSYGGYFTALAMTRLDCIAAGISGAPVTDWAHYDTIYTERFMSTPQRNPDGYRESSVVARADKLKGRLLLLHGFRDDNVHPENSIQLIHALQQSGRQFDVMFYPTARHAIQGEHYQRLLFDFILRTMGRPQPQSTTP
jgi:dipeptidyl-peptidase-4